MSSAMGVPRAVRTPLIAGNWKMNTTVPEGLSLLSRIRARPRPPGVEVAVLPPFLHLWPAREALAGSGILLGAQDTFWEASGAFTGEISPVALAGVCDLVLAGHSERRHLLGEDDDQVARKLRAALAAGLLGVLAVGETLAEREAGDELRVVRRQLDSALGGLPPGAIDRCVVAYEPVWAIGTGRTASAADAEAMCRAIRGHCGDLAGAAAADRLRILYGGSLTPDNAAELLAETDVDGGLVGGASLDVERFGRIIDAAAGVTARSA